MALLVTDQNIGQGLTIAATKLLADLGVGLVFNGNKIDVDGASVPLTVALSTPGAANLQAAVNGNLSNILDLTPLIQAGETNTTLTYAPATKTLTFTNEDGTVANIDLSALAVDIFVDGASYDAGTMVLTLTDNDGVTPNITINLADLKQVVTQATQSISFTGTGESSSPLQANVVLDPIAGNLLKVTAAGTKVDPADIAVTSDYGITGNGQAATPIEFNADELELHWEDTGNPAVYFVMSTPYRPAGTRVDTSQVGNEIWTYVIEPLAQNTAIATVNGMLTVDVQDLAGTHLFYALP